MSQAAQIVHESETQRQFVRLKLPATCEIDGKRYSIKDLSSGGFALRGISDNFKQRKIIELTLTLPFTDFSIDVNLVAEMLYYDKKQDIAGCRFVDLNFNQISILNHVIKAFMSGDAISANDVINVVARDNFANLRQHNNNTATPLAETIKKYSLYCLAAISILILSSFIIYNIYERLYILSTPYGQVLAQHMEVVSPASGSFKSALPENTLTVQKGQTLGILSTQTNVGSALGSITKKLKIISPCDCYITEKHHSNNNHQAENSKLFSLLPQNADIYIQAYVPYENVKSLKIGNTATAFISGRNSPTEATITNIKTDENSFLSKETPVALVQMKTKQALPKDLIYRPAFIEFYL